MANFKETDDPCSCSCHTPGSSMMHFAPCCFYSHMPRPYALKMAKEARERIAKAEGKETD